MRQSSQPRYRILAETLIDGIVKGRYPVGSKLPIELELCKQFGVSRFTMRSALRHLQDLGLISRSKSVGTTVTSNIAVRNYVQSLGSLDELFQYASETYLHVTSIKEVIVNDPEYSDLLACKPGRAWLQVQGWRSLIETGRPVSWTEIFVNGMYAAIADDICDGCGPFYEMLQRRFGVTVNSIEQHISSVQMPRSATEVLSVKAGCPALRIARHYYSMNGELLEVSVSLHPGDRHSYKTRLQLHQPS